MKRLSAVDPIDDVDKLWPGEAEVGAMLRTQYRRHPPAEVMLGHLAVLEEHVPLMSQPEHRSVLRSRRVALILVAMLLLGLLGAGATRLQTSPTADEHLGPGVLQEPFA